jgi:hypothetical protein
MGWLQRSLVMGAMMMVMACGGAKDVKTEKGTFRVPGKAKVAGSPTSVGFMIAESGREVPGGFGSDVELTGHRTVERAGKERAVFRVKYIGGVSNEWFDERYFEPAAGEP